MLASRIHWDSYKINKVFQLCRHISFDSRWKRPEGITTDILIYNCAAKRKVPFILNNAHYITWYTCGPTVYDSCHLGHASCYLKLDIIQRILRHHFNLNIVSAMNITDIDDKIILKSSETGHPWQEIARFYEAEFWSDLKRLNVLEPNVKVRVSDYIPQIVFYIKDIIKKNKAYVGRDNSVYFDVKSFDNYNKLQNLNLDENRNEIDKSNNNKRSPLDFALWKARKTNTEPSWESPWGAGRPGWHIECSVLAGIIFGNSVHIHAGGIDLQFPHHENEEAQSCVYHNIQQWVNYWVHTGHLRVKGQTEKMSKSLKNTITIKDMLSTYSADEFRMACVLSNYQNHIEYSDELMEMARNTLNRFKTFKDDCSAYVSGKKTAVGLNDSLILQNLEFTRSHIDECLRDNFDTSRCIRILLDQISSISRCINMPETETLNLQTTSSLDAMIAVSNYVQFILNSFGLVCNRDYEPNMINQINLNGLLEGIIDARKIIRDRAIANKNTDLFQICDELRNTLRRHGIEVRDHNQGSSWNFIKIN